MSFCREAKCCCLMSPTMWQWWKKKKAFTSRHRPCKASTPSYFVRHLIYVFIFLIGQIKPFPLPTKEENYLLIHHGTSFQTVWTAIAAPHTSVHLHGLPLQRHHVWGFLFVFFSQHSAWSTQHSFQGRVQWRRCRRLRTSHRRSSWLCRWWPLPWRTARPPCPWSSRKWPQLWKMKKNCKMAHCTGESLNTMINSGY